MDEMTALMGETKDVKALKMVYVTVLYSVLEKLTASVRDVKDAGTDVKVSVTDVTDVVTDETAEEMAETDGVRAVKDAVTGATDVDEGEGLAYYDYDSCYPLLHLIPNYLLL